MDDKETKPEGGIPDLSEPVQALGIPDEETKPKGNPALDLPEIVVTYLGAVTGYTQENNNYYFTDGHASVQVKVVSDEIIRVRLAPTGQFLADFSYAVSQVDKHVELYTLEETIESYKVKTNTVTCVIRKADFLISFEDRLGESYNQDHGPMHWKENIDFGGYYVYCTKRLREREAFYGLGDKASHLNLRGRGFTNWNSDIYAFRADQDPLYRSIPFYISLNEGKAHGIFFDNTYRTSFDFATGYSDHTGFGSEGGELQYYYIHGPSMMDVVKRYHLLTGTHYLPPLWALGYHQSRMSYYPENKVRDLAANFRERKIPCDAIYLDIDYMDGYRCFTWNKRYFPDPRRMIKELADAGFRTVVIVDPGIKVDDSYWVYKEGKENRYFCRRGDDYFMEGYVWPGRCQFPDFTNEKVRRWWGGLHQDLVDTGVAGVWNDMNEPAIFGRGTFPHDVRHNYDGHRGSHRKAHNIYGMQMVRATYEGLRKLSQKKRPFTITRAAYPGTQRYASVWTGDNVASWEHLRIGLLQLQRLSVSGLSFCGTDIGGFSGEPDAELFARWLQFGVFSPFMRSHSAGDTKAREPWSFGEYWEAINRKFIELRYKLLPYIYSVFWEQTQYGSPILRPVTMVEQHLETNMNRQEEFCFGDNILVSPVLHPQQKTKIVYLPAGEWYYYFDNGRISGGQEITVETPIDEMPMYIKAGAVLPEYPVMQYVGEKRIESLKLLVYHGCEEVNSYVYEDDGDTFGYERHIYLEKKFVSKTIDRKFIINQYVDGLYSECYDNYDVHLVGIPFEVSGILVDDRPIAFDKDEKKQYIVRVPKDFRRLIVS